MRRRGSGAARTSPSCASRPNKRPQRSPPKPSSNPAQARPRARKKRRSSRRRHRRGKTPERSAPAALGRLVRNIVARHRRLLMRPARFFRFGFCRRRGRVRLGLVALRFGLLALGFLAFRLLPLWLLPLCLLAFGFLDSRSLGLSRRRRRITAGVDHVSGERGRLFTTARIVLAQEQRQGQIAPAVRQAARGLVACSAIVREQFGGRL